MNGYRQNHRFSHNHTHHHSPSGDHQHQRRYDWRRSNYPSSRQHQNVHNNSGTNYSWFYGDGSYTEADHEQFWYRNQTPDNNPGTNYSSFGGRGGRGSYTEADYEQYWCRYQTHVFQPPMAYFSVSMILPAVVVSNRSPYGPNYELDYSNDMTNQLIDQERNLSDDLFNFLDYMDGHDEEKEDDDDVLKYLEIRTIHAPAAKDGVDPKVVADEESESCAICQSEFEHEESIGTLHCGHEYHMNCIKKWLLRKKDCPICRASVLPS